jgi:hypothetical protein
MEHNEIHFRAEFKKSPTNPAPIPSLTAVRRINIDVKAPSITL